MMLMMFCAMEMTMGKRVFCIPMNQPVRLLSPKTAGAPHTTMSKYDLTKGTTSSLGAMR